jgi:threonine aldolase
MGSVVRFHGDGLSLTPQESSLLLQQLTTTPEFAPDWYSRGGVVEQLETKVADMLGKERAIFLPTGTLANHLAVRTLCGGQGRRVVAQAESHLVNDAGDCAQTLSGLNLIPLATGQICFSTNELEQLLARTRDGKVATEIGALSIETPVRRLDNAAIPLAEMEKLTAVAREAGIGLHLDGARLALYTTHFGVDPAKVAALFDTVYLSMYKCFSAPSGAVLAGSVELIDGLYHTRRMFGGGLREAWPFAAIALYHLDGFADLSRQVLSMAEALFASLAEDKRCVIERVPNGTNVFKLRSTGTDPETWRRNLLARNVELPEPEPASDLFVCKMNPTWLRSTTAELSQALLESLEA